MMLRSLAFKWTMTLLLTSLIGVVLVGVFAYRTTSTAYDQLRADQAQALFIQNITTYYQTNQTWAGLEAWLRADADPAAPRDGFRFPDQYALVDLNNAVVLGHGPFHVGDVVDAYKLAEGSPLLIDGLRVGTVLEAQPPPDLDPRERQYINATTQALLIGAVGAGAMALVVGLLLSRQFLRPLSELTRAITAMHSGDLDQRVEIRTRDELGLLARTFNEMSSNLYRANQLRKQMTADIAHDLRTPLTVIGGYIEALRDGTLKPTPARFQAMSEEVNLLKRLVEDLRTLSLADAGELRLMGATLPPRELLERVAESFQPVAASAEVQLQVHVSAGVPNIWIDSERMVQVLGNLVTNALRHTPEGGSVTLTAAQQADKVALTVTDTGSGIAPDDLPKVFDRFYRADPSRTSDGDESGLGLAIARSIVEAHKGTITAESTLGKGTTMTILLPAQRA